MSETMPEPLQDIPPFSGHSPAQARPLGGYAVLISTYGLASCVFGTWFRRSGRELPTQIDHGLIGFRSELTIGNGRDFSIGHAQAAEGETFREDQAGVIENHKRCQSGLWS